MCSRYGMGLLFLTESRNRICITAPVPDQIFRLLSALAPQHCLYMRNVFSFETGRTTDNLPQYLRRQCRPVNKTEKTFFLRAPNKDIPEKTFYKTILGPQKNISNYLFFKLIMKLRILSDFQISPQVPVYRNYQY